MPARDWSLIGNTLFLVLGTLAVSLPVGTALAVLLFRTDIALRRSATAALCVLLIVPLYLQAAAWQAGFGTSGWYTLWTAGPYQPGLLEGWRGAIWVHALAAIPWIMLIVGLALRFAEPELEEAALLDGSLRQVLLRVTVRQALPAIGLAAVWVAIIVATEMTVTDLFQTGSAPVRTYAEEIYTQSQLWSEPPSPAIGWVLTGGLALAALLLSAAAGRWRPQLSPRPPLVFRIGNWQMAAVAIVAAVVLTAVGVPLASLIFHAGSNVTRSGDDFVRGWSLVRCWNELAATPRRYESAIGWSLAMAAGAATMVLIVAAPLGWLARHGRLGAVPALALTVAAMAVPGPLIGMGLIDVFNDPNWPRLNMLYDRTIGVVCLAQAIRAFPVGMLIVWHALRMVPGELLEAAAVDGAGGLARFWRVVLPLRWPAFGLAWLAVFAVALGELSATILVVPPGIETLGVLIARLLHFNFQNELAALCLFLLLSAAVVAVGMYGLAAWLGRRLRSAAADQL